jgi:hypothetical protein
MEACITINTMAVAQNNESKFQKLFENRPFKGEDQMLNIFQ